MIHSVLWVISLRGDGKATKVSLPIATSPVFATCPQLDSPRLQRPTDVYIDEVSAGPGHYQPEQVGEVNHTHQPMIDGHEDVPYHVLEEGAVKLDAKGEPVIVQVKRPRKVPGPSVTIKKPIFGEAPALPTVSANVEDGVLHLDLDQPIRAGEEIGISGTFIYDLGGKS